MLCALLFFADLNVRIVLRGPPPAPAAIHMANSELRLCVCVKRPKRHTAFFPFY